MSLVLSLAFFAVGLAAPDRLAHVLEVIRRFVVATFGLAYVGIVFALLPFLLLLALTPFGRTRLGGPQDRPEFGWVSWIAMLLSAGVGLSFLFWGTAEPLIHFADPPQGSGVAETEEAARTGLRYSFLFWGLHAWATYGVVAVAVGYAGFRSGRSMLVSSRKAVATFAVLDTLPLTATVSVVVVVVLALLFITSADSASFMLGSTTSGGSMEPPRPLRLVWSFSAAFAAVLLLGGGTTSLQGAAIVAAVPFAVILVCLCVALTVVAVRGRESPESRRAARLDPQEPM